MRRLASCWHAAAGAASAAAPCRGYKSHRVALRKRLGQHLLKNPDVVRNIVRSANVQPHELVLEIGPGTGNMTVPLLEKAKGVFAVELDPDMHLAVTNRVRGLGLDHKFVCVRGDFLRVPLLEGINVCVANIPYQISSPVIRRLLAYRPLMDRAIIMFQEEFGERMVAKPGMRQYCRLSVNSALLSDVRTIMKVNRNQFMPPPKVDSIVVEIRPKNFDGIADFESWDSFLKICFSGKNKTLYSLFGVKAVLSKIHPEPAVLALPDTRAQYRQDVAAVLASVGMSASRPNAMTPHMFLTVYHALLRSGCRFSPAAEDSDGSSTEQEEKEDEEDPTGTEGSTSV